MVRVSLSNGNCLVGDLREMGIIAGSSYMLGHVGIVLLVGQEGPCIS